MSMVVALVNIPGLKAGKIGEMTEQRRKHVDAGNAAVIPGEHAEWEGAPPSAPVEPITIHTTGSVDDAPADEGEPEYQEDLDAVFDADDDDHDDETTGD